MPATKFLNDSQSVTQFIEKLEPSFGKVIESIRQIILSTSPEIGEQIKWNAPSFFYTGEMKPFNLKEYKRDIVVVNVQKGYALLVFPTGARVADPTGLLEGNYTDGRRMAKFNSLDEVNRSASALKKVIKLWLEGVEKG